MIHKDTKKAVERKGPLPGALVPEESRKRAAMERISLAIEEKEYRYAPSIWELIHLQLQYISWQYWIGQSSLLLVFILIFYRMGLVQAGVMEYLNWFSMGAALVNILGVLEIRRHISYRMAEVEQSCYWNLQQMWMSKMILFTGVDILILGSFMWGISLRTKQSFYAVCIYLLVPFMLSNLCYLFLLCARKSRGGRVQYLGMAFATCMAAVIPSNLPAVYQINFLWVWISVLAAACVLCVRQTAALYRNIKEGETICWN